MSSIGKVFVVLNLVFSLVILGQGIEVVVNYAAYGFPEYTKY